MTIKMIKLAVLKINHLPVCCYLCR